MEDATIGDDIGVQYEMVWDDRTRTTDEIGDLDEAGFDATIEDIVDIAKDDPDCEVRVIGFQ